MQFSTFAVAMLVVCSSLSTVEANFLFWKRADPNSKQWPNDWYAWLQEDLPPVTPKVASKSVEGYVQKLNNDEQQLESSMSSPKISASNTVPHAELSIASDNTNLASTHEHAPTDLAREHEYEMRSQ
jgi:hypothetical protein